MSASSLSALRGGLVVGLACLLGLGLMSPTAGATSTPPAPASSGPSAAATLSPLPTGAQPSSVEVSGHGLGPGWGMGQWGAYGYASLSAYKWGYRRIIGRYYGGAHLARAPAAIESAAVKVDLSALDGDSSTTVMANRAGAYLVVDGTRHRGRITIAHHGRTITVRADKGDVRVDLGGEWRAYQGYIQIQPDGETWNVVGLEDYVAGVVPIEMSAGWGATGGEAALQAQAIAARSYVLDYVGQVGHTCDSQECQVYQGDPGTNPNIGSYVGYSDRATSSTSGEVVCTADHRSCPGADIALTQYASSTGGYTSGAGFHAVADGGDAVSANPWHDWSISVPVASIQAVYPQLGTLTSLAVTKRNGLGAMGGRAITVAVTGKKGAVTVSASGFEDALGLYSDWFRFSTQP
jgi:SpoIID/LytB domain protein